jgi:hypothetical protein
MSPFLPVLDKLILVPQPPLCCFLPLLPLLQRRRQPITTDITIASPPTQPHSRRQKSRRQLRLCNEASANSTAESVRTATTTALASRCSSRCCNAADSPSLYHHHHNRLSAHKKMSTKAMEVFQMGNFSLGMRLGGGGCDYSRDALETCPCLGLQRRYAPPAVALASLPLCIMSSAKQLDFMAGCQLSAGHTR